MANNKKAQLPTDSTIKDLIVNNDAGISCLDNSITFQMRIAEGKLPPEEFSCSFNNYETLKNDNTDAFKLYTHSKSY